MKLKYISTFTAINILFMLNIAVFGQNSEKIELGNLHQGEIEYSAFELLENSTINIEGKAGNFGGNFSENLAFYGWIVDSDTREIVWDARDDFEFDDKNGIFSFEDQEPLEKGFYEVYYSSSRGYNYEVHNFSDLISKVFSGSKKKSFKNKYRSQLSITVTGEDGKFRETDAIEVVNNLVENSVVSITSVMDDEDSEAGFSLNDDTEIRIYTIGEGYEDEIIDFAWISDVKTNQIVWKAELENSSHAGGGRKNYVIDEEIELTKGSYILHYSSDDSHSFERWNVMPPNDPQFWGATIWAVSEGDRQNVIPFRKEDVVKPMIDLTKVGDDEYLSKGFTISKTSNLRVLGVGEGYREEEMSDYGWIINADTKELVWTMNDNNKLEHAGGSKKNLMVEETITLEKGNYIAYYLSDDSHSYEDWNSSNPFNRASWGLTIWSDENDFKLFDGANYKSENIISEIVKVEDNEDLEESFRLNSNTKIRIIAIGEGDRSGMNDYGWIEDSDGDVIWEMTYRKTEHAGGAKKNRLCNRTISLDAGKYSLHYTTDGSHSFEDWNSSPPANQESYGITVMKDN